MWDVILYQIDFIIHLVIICAPNFYKTYYKLALKLKDCFKIFIVIDFFG